MASAEFTGSCLCGRIGYRIEGELKNFFHCHCGRCRKATGTGHASNLIVSYEAQRWTRGADLLARFDVPGAKRFHTVFCTACGSPMPRIAAERRIAVIPAGSLDSSPDLRPTGRIFQDSRSPWSCGGDDLPAWEQYPA